MALSSWHREEPREVRPFFETLQAEEALNGCGIRLFDGAEVWEETSFDLDEIDFKRLAPAVQLVLVRPEAWLPSGLTVETLELVLIARHSFLKRAAAVQTATLDQELPKEWVIGPEVLEHFGGGRNLELTIALCLRTDRPPAPGTPFVAGHWIAKKSFHFRSRTMPTLFDLRTRKDEEWVAKGYPPKTFYAVEYIGGIDSELDEGASVATVWIHIDAHNKLVSSSLGESLQPVLATEIITTILLESFREWKDSDSIDSTSPLTTLMKQLGKEKTITLADLKTLVANPPLLKATLQDRLFVVGTLK
ncbi:hypothetical protein SAMN04515648_2881 [Phyllobacterium sp. CL33Tsu]|uniref:hypothetical protein n=1 Tax=Phyllobacterium sp. CL33Tsu TaxID=1798191 RepID=UPI0008ECA00F|nr:hypothetical protein [Phyllobacterium sp. CL33Tsu]SFJ14851.1 hypothetical protein SAMN04515648_2881 [Phyllobacterium sp. CL33Tsu]